MDIRKLINQIALEENELSTTQFIGPCVRGGKVRTKVAGDGLYIHSKTKRF